MEIYKKLACINRAIEAIKKGRTNLQQGFKYRGIDDVMNDLHVLFAENDVFIIPCVKELRREERTTAKGSALIYTHLTIDFNFATTDGSSVTSSVYGEAMDSADKSTNKAMSVALKYALLQMFLIPTEDDKDPDANSHNVTAISLEQALKELNATTSKEAATVVWRKYPQYHKNDQFIETAKQKNK